MDFQALTEVQRKDTSLSDSTTSLRLREIPFPATTTTLDVSPPPVYGGRFLTACIPYPTLASEPHNVSPLPGMSGQASTWRFTNGLSNAYSANILRSKNTCTCWLLHSRCVFCHVHIDIVGPLPTSKGYTHLLTLVDHFTHWPSHSTHGHIHKHSRPWFTAGLGSTLWSTHYHHHRSKRPV